MRFQTVGFAFAFAVACPAGASAQQCDFVVDTESACIVVDGFSRPESAQPHDETGWYISNMGTALGNGFITRIGHDGCVTRKWFDGLDFPKGIDLFQGKLYVTSLQRVVII